MGITRLTIKSMLTCLLVSHLAMGFAVAGDALPYHFVAPKYNSINVFKEGTNGFSLVKDEVFNKAQKYEIVQADKSMVCPGGTMLRLKNKGWVCNNNFNPIVAFSDEKQGKNSSNNKEGKRAKATSLQKISANRNTTKPSDSNRINNSQIIKEKMPEYADIIDSVDKGTIYQTAESEAITNIMVGKNYMNRIYCPGKIEGDILYNKNQNIEIFFDEQNVYVKAPNNSMDQFLSNLIVRCSGEVFQINLVFDAGLPGQFVKMKAPKMDVDAKDVRFSGQNFENKIVNMLAMLYDNKMSGAWRVNKMFKELGPSTILKKVDTRNEGIYLFDAVSLSNKKDALNSIQKFLIENGYQFIASGFLEGNVDKDRLLIAALKKSGRQ